MIKIINKWFKQTFKPYGIYRLLVLRLLLGVTVILWGYEKLNLSNMAEMYVKDYGAYMMMDVATFLQVFGWINIVIGVLLIIGLLTRLSAAIVALMGILTIIIPGAIVLKDVPHFAYAFALTGAALVLLVEGAGKLASLDSSLSG